MTGNKKCQKYEPAAIANNILWLAKEDEVQISPMKLLKLLYFVYGWTLALQDRKLFDEPIRAWKHGPVIPSVYYQFQMYGRGAIDCFASSAEINEKTGEIMEVRYPVVDTDDQDVHDIISAIWDNYKHCDAWKLSMITHENDSAWSKAWAKGDYTHLEDADIKKRSWEGIQKKYGDISEA